MFYVRAYRDEEDAVRPKCLDLDPGSTEGIALVVFVCKATFLLWRALWRDLLLFGTSLVLPQRKRSGCEQSHRGLVMLLILQPVGLEKPSYQIVMVHNDVSRMVFFKQEFSQSLSLLICFAVKPMSFKKYQY
jgi:hypothetical protein